MPLIWKLIFIIWDLVDSSSLPSGKVQSFIGTQMQKPLYDFSISKVMTVCISTFARICDFQPNANAWFNSTCNHPPPGIPPGICNFALTWQSIPHPRARKKETIPHPRDCSSTTNTLFCVQNIDYDIDFRTIAKPDILART